MTTTTQSATTMTQQRMQFYTQQVTILTCDMNRMKRWNKYFIFAEVSSFLLILLGLVAYAFWDAGIYSLLFSLLSLGAYLLIRHKDIGVIRLVEHQENLCSVYQKELKYLAGDFSCFQSGEQYIDPHHEFTYDMDIFGTDSLFQRINRTITTGGSDLLAQQLGNAMQPSDITSGMTSNAMQPSMQQTVESICAHREAVNELSERESLRTEYLSYGQRECIHTTTIQEALQTASQLNMPQFPRHIFSFVLAQVAIWGLLVAVVLAVLKMVSWNLPLAWASVQFVIVYLSCSRSVRMMNKMVGRIHKQLKPYISLVNVLSSANLTSKENKAIIDSLYTDGVSATEAFNQLKGILDGLDRRGNVMGLILFNTFFLTDFFLVRKFIRWQTQYMSHIEGWVEAISRFDALVSMATFRYNEPEAIDAEVIVADKVVYEAHGLYHPFLGAKAVRNDFSVTDSHYYIITGANMAGKSTFLRSVGINYILASCGMPVFAEQFTMSVFLLFSSMRTTDDLTRGISYFNAELLRLKQLLAYCRRNRHTLIILDEILKGTNSLDKLNGSRLFLETISQLPVTGIIATHDLELSKMSDAYPERFHNYCFEIELSSRITYSYQISAGIARNQNATYLLKNILSAQ